jgi:hypothetical protein
LIFYTLATRSGYAPSVTPPRFRSSQRARKPNAAIVTKTIMAPGEAVPHATRRRSLLPRTERSSLRISDATHVTPPLRSRG